MGGGAWVVVHGWWCMDGGAWVDGAWVVVHGRMSGGAWVDEWWIG